ncbi:hypothetical protein DNTS_023462, partial [Danionella cerebrum]
MRQEVCTRSSSGALLVISFVLRLLFLISCRFLHVPPSVCPIARYAHPISDRSVCCHVSVCWWWWWVPAFCCDAPNGVCQCVTFTASSRSEHKLKETLSLFYRGKEKTDVEGRVQAAPFRDLKDICAYAHNRCAPDQTETEAASSANSTAVPIARLCDAASHPNSLKVNSSSTKTAVLSPQHQQSITEVRQLVVRPECGSVWLLFAVFNSIAVCGMTDAVRSRRNTVFTRHKSVRPADLLHKYNRGRVKTWKRRWFILTDNCLYYFEYTTDKEPRGIIPLENLSIREVEDKKPNCFELFISDSRDRVIKACKTEADGRVVEGNHTFYRISAPTQEEKDEWINSIRCSQPGRKGSPPRRDTRAAENRPPRPRAVILPLLNQAAAVPRFFSPSISNFTKLFSRGPHRALLQSWKTKDFHEMFLVNVEEVSSEVRSTQASPPTDSL